MTIVVAAVIVAAIAVSVSLLAGGDDGTVVTEVSTGLTIAPAPEVQQPSQETWEELLPRLEEEVAAAPGDVNLQRKLALAYYNLGQYDKAAGIYRHLLAAGEDAVLRSRLGNTLRDMGDAAGAEAAYRQAIEDDPTLPALYLDLAELLWRQGRDDEALAALDDGLTAVPEESQAVLVEARAVIEGGSR